MKKIIPYGHQWIDNEDIKAVVKVLKSDWLTQGPVVEEFEKSIAKYCGVKYAVAFSSGTSALYSAYMAGELKEGDEVITTPLTFAATSNMICFCHAKPVFADIEKDTLNIDPKDILKKITKKTRAIATVDFAGNPCNYQEIFKIAKDNDLLLIEDACHAFGAQYKGKKTGSFADMTIFSFHPVKHITTGEGGMVVTNNKVFFERLKLIRNHGMIKKPENGPWYFEIENPSFNFRITDIQCALGLSQLNKIEKFIAKRKEIAKIYTESFKNIEGIIIPTEEHLAKSSWHIYPIRVNAEKRMKIFEMLQKDGIKVHVHYMPLHLHPFYKKQFGYKEGDFKNAEEYYNSAITIPLFPKMTKKEINYVISFVKKAVLKNR